MARSVQHKTSPFTTNQSVEYSFSVEKTTSIPSGCTNVLKKKRKIKKNKKGKTCTHLHAVFSGQRTHVRLTGATL